jgi:hypothetical protein
MKSIINIKYQKDITKNNKYHYNYQEHIEHCKEDPYYFQENILHNKKGKRYFQNKDHHYYTKHYNYNGYFWFNDKLFH